MDEQRPGQGPETALSVAAVSSLIGDWIARLGSVWVEGQLSQISVRSGLSYLTLHDLDRDAVVKMHIPSNVLASVQPPLEQGSRVLVQAKADWWVRSGSLSMKVLQIRAVGVGELMARIEALRNVLAAEGLFNAERKIPLPFLPRRIGLICGRNSDAMHDVLNNSRRRWPDIEFVVREVAVQGTGAVKQVCDALTELDAIDDVDVIVVARGGGSFEDLLPFSDETLVRTVAQIETPVVSAIGHEQDRPLIDYVADFRASTPTDAAKNIVPDIVEETAWVRNSLAKNRLAVTTRLTFLQEQLAATRAKPALAAPHSLIEQRQLDIGRIRTVVRTAMEHRLNLESARLHSATSALRALSPKGTLARGYSVVRNASGQIIRSASELPIGLTAEILLHDGRITVRREA